MTEPKIKGLTLRHPWAWGFQHGKDVENRTWHPSRQGGQIGMYIALHGGALPPKRGEYWNEITDAVNWMGQKGLPCAPAARVLLRDVREDSPSKWAAQGQFHWCLEVTPLPQVVPHKGAQGLWTLEPQALTLVRELFRQARAGA